MKHALGRMGDLLRGHYLSYATRYCCGCGAGCFLSVLAVGIVLNHFEIVRLGAGVVAELALRFRQSPIDVGVFGVRDERGFESRQGSLPFFQREVIGANILIFLCGFLMRRRGKLLTPPRLHDVIRHFYFVGALKARTESDVGTRRGTGSCIFGALDGVGVVVKQRCGAAVGAAARRRRQRCGVSGRGHNGDCSCVFRKRIGLGRLGLLRRGLLRLGRRVRLRILQGWSRLRGHERHHRETASHRERNLKSSLHPFFFSHSCDYLHHFNVTMRCIRYFKSPEEKAHNAWASSSDHLPYTQQVATPQLQFAKALALPSTPDRALPRQKPTALRTRQSPIYLDSETARWSSTGTAWRCSSIIVATRTARRAK